MRNRWERPKTGLLDALLQRKKARQRKFSKLVGKVRFVKSILKGR